MPTDGAPGVAPARVAFGDESFHEHPSDGFYVLAAVVVEAATSDDLRAAMQALLRRFRGRRHEAALE